MEIEEKTQYKFGAYAVRIDHKATHKEVVLSVPANDNRLIPPSGKFSAICNIEIIDRKQCAGCGRADMFYQSKYGDEAKESVKCAHCGKTREEVTT